MVRCVMVRPVSQALQARSNPLFWWSNPSFRSRQPTAMRATATTATPTPTN